LSKAGIGGVYPLIDIDNHVFQLTVDPGRIGIVQLNGLNPIAAAVESGIVIESTVGAGLIEYQHLKSVEKLNAAKTNKRHNLIWD
jgi:repressor of nif and glnA expression